MGGQLLGVLALFGVLLGHLFDDPTRRDISRGLTQGDEKHLLLLEGDASSDAGHEDDGTSKHARSSGGGLSGRHVCVLFLLRQSACDIGLSGDSMYAYRRSVERSWYDVMWMVCLCDGFLSVML